VEVVVMAAHAPEPDVDRGIGALFAFIVAILVMVVAVIAVASVGAWWLLIPVTLVDLVTAFVVIGMIMRLLGDDGEPPL
jgi:hypothetical protein